MEMEKGKRPGSSAVPSPPSPRSWVQLLIVFLMLFLAFVAAATSLQRLEDAERQAAVTEAQEELAQIVAHLERNATPEHVARTLMQRVISALLWDGDLALLSRSFPADTLRIFVFDATGQRIRYPGATTAMSNISQRYLELLLHAEQDSTYVLTRSEANLATTFAGVAGSVEFLAPASGDMLSLSSLHKRGFGGWSRVEFANGQRGFLIIWFDQNRLSRNFLAVQAVQNIAKRLNKDFLLGWADLAAPNSNGSSAGRRLSPSFVKLICQRHLRRSFPWQDRLIAITTTSNGIRLVGVRSLPGTTTRSSGRPLDLLRLSAFIITVVLLWQSLSQKPLRLSIRTQMIGIFTIAGLAGFSSLLGFSNHFRQTKEAGLIRQIRQEAIRILEKTDSDFLASFAPLLTQYRALVKEIEQHPRHTPDALRLLDDWCNDGTLEIALMRDIKDAILFETPGDRPNIRRGRLALQFSEFMHKMVTQIFRKFSQEEKTQDDTTEKTKQGSMMSVLLDMPMNAAIRNRSSLQTLTFAETSMTNYLEFILDQTGKAVCCLTVVHDTQQLEKRHLVNVQRSLTHHSKFRLVAVPSKGRGTLRSIPDTSIAQEPTIMQIVDLLNQTGTIQHSTGRIRGENNLVTAMPGKMMKDFHLLLLTPFDPVAEESRRYEVIFLAMAMTSLLFAGFVGWLLANMLIDPVQILMFGTECLRTSNFRHTIKINSGDELETIAQGLNEALMDQKEFAIAKVVQENLMPSTALRSDCLQIVGWRKSEADMSGSLFDYHFLPDGRLAFLFSDASALGISPALVMAMTKMTLYHLLELLEGPPSVILEEVDQHFRLHMRTLCPMAIVFGWVTPHDCMVSWSGGGDISVFVLSRSGNCNPLPLAETGLGSQLQQRCRDWNHPLQAEERLLIVNHGLLERISGVNAATAPSSPVLQQTCARLAAVPHADLGLFLDQLTASPESSEHNQRDLMAIILERRPHT